MLLAFRPVSAQEYDVTITGPFHEVSFPDFVRSIERTTPVRFYYLEN